MGLFTQILHNLSIRRDTSSESNNILLSYYERVRLPQKLSLLSFLFTALGFIHHPHQPWLVRHRHFTLQLSLASRFKFTASSFVRSTLHAAQQLTFTPRLVSTKATFTFPFTLDSFLPHPFSEPVDCGLETIESSIRPPGVDHALPPLTRISAGFNLEHRFSCDMTFLRHR